MMNFLLGSPLLKAFSFRIWWDMAFGKEVLLGPSAYTAASWIAPRLLALLAPVRHSRILGLFHRQSGENRYTVGVAGYLLHILEIRPTT